MSSKAPARAGSGPRTEGGVVAEHRPRVSLPLLVAPATGQEENTYRPELVPLACFRLDDIRFGISSSFVGPGAAVELGRFAALREAKPGLLASVFGHADPAGDDGINKALSGRRAKAVYGFLTRDGAPLDVQRLRELVQSRRR